jgi:hypothetical protein
LISTTLWSAAISTPWAKRWLPQEVRADIEQDIQAQKQALTLNPHVSLASLATFATLIDTSSFRPLLNDFVYEYKQQKNNRCHQKPNGSPRHDLHGDTRIDNYYWLRDDERSRPEVLDYLREENEYGKQ